MQHAEFIIRTDHKSLLYLTEQRVSSKIQHKALMKRMDLQFKIVHSSVVGGHSGFQATYYRIRHLFAWPGMKTDIMRYVHECQVCQQAKSEHVKTPGSLQPLPVPQQG